MEESTICPVDYDESFYAEDELKPDKYRLVEISKSVEQLMSPIYNIKQKIEDDLRDLTIKVDDFIDFKLDTMKILSRLTEKLPVHKFLKGSYTGFFIAMLHSEVILQTTKNLEEQKMVKELLRNFTNVLLVIANALKMQGWSVPDSKLERQHFPNLKKTLVSLGEEYIKENPNSALLRTHKQIIVDFQIIKEMETSIRRLRQLIEKLRENCYVNTVTREGENVFHSEMMETATVWGTFWDLENN